MAASARCFLCWMTPYSAAGAAAAGAASAGVAAGAAVVAGAVSAGWAAGAAGCCANGAQVELKGVGTI